MNLRLTLLIVWGFVSSVGWTQNLLVQAGDVYPGGIEKLVKQVFKGEGVEILDVKLEGEAFAMGYFTQGELASSIDNGLILTTGRADSAAQANYSKNLSTTSSGNRVVDPNLDSILNSLDENIQLKDVLKLSIRFIPSADRVQFNYVFSSEEYPEFTCGIYNDVFGFFVDGPNPLGGNYHGKNIAIVPGTEDQIVAINSVHNGNPIKSECLPAHPEYYFPLPELSPLMSYNARLQKFTASLSVTPCTPYTITLSLADVADDRYDTAIFLEANSFSSDPLQVVLETPLGDGVIVEGCTPATIRIILPEPAAADIVIPYTITGQAFVEEDFSILGDLMINKDDSSMTLQVLALADGLVETEEVLQFIFAPTECSQDTVTIRIRDFIPPIIPELRDTVLCEDQILTYDFSPPDGGSLEYRNISNQPIPDSGNLEIPLILTDLSIGQVSYLGISEVCVHLDHPNVQDLSIYLDNPLGDRLCLVDQIGESGERDFHNLCFSIGGLPIDMGVAPYDGIFSACGDWSNWFSVPVIPAEGTWKLIIVDHHTGSIGKLNHWSIEFQDTGEASYNWYFDQEAVCQSCQTLEFKPSHSGFLKMEQVDLFGCSASDSSYVEVISAQHIGNVECLTIGQEMIFSWPEAHGVQYFVSRDSLNWIRPNRSNNTHSISPVVPGRDYLLFLRTVSSCMNHGHKISCTATPCENPAFSISAKKDISCFGARDGKIQLISGGQPLNFWLNGEWQENGKFVDLHSGEYVAIAQAANGCRNYLEFSIDEPEPLSATYQIMKDVVCYGAEDGSVQLKVVQNQGSYIVHWDNHESGPNPQKLHAGVNMVMIRDDHNCTLNMLVKLNQPVPISFAAEVTPMACGVANSGSILVKTSGGAGDFQYYWPATGKQDTLLNQIDSGRYLLTLKDDNNCQLDTSVYVPYIPPLIVDYKKGDAACSASGFGYISLNPIGGDGNYTFRWNNGSQLSHLVNLDPGDYCGTVTDESGCQDQICLSVEDEYDVFQIAEVLQPNCISGPLGEVAIKLKEDYQPYSLIWSGPHRYSSKGQGIHKLESGEYTVFISDQNGCFHTRSFQIDKLDTLIYQVDTQHVACFGEKDGNLSVNVTQSNGAIWYSLDSTYWQLNPLFRDLAAGEYQLYLRDEAGCTSNQSVEVYQPDSLILSLGPDTTIYYGAEFALQPRIENAQGAILYQWQLPDFFTESCTDCPLLVLHPEQSFSTRLRIFDENGCSADDFIRVFVESGQDIQVPSLFTPNSDGQNDLLIVHGSPGISILNFHVFDGKGNMVYRDSGISINDLSRGWNGMMHGQPAPPGIYTWTVAALLANGRQHSAKGVTLLRK